MTKPPSTIVRKPIKGLGLGLKKIGEPGYRSFNAAVRALREPPERIKRLKAKRKPKKTKIGLWREWLVPDRAYRRYSGLRGILWYWLSRDVRKSEWEKWGGECLTCLVPLQDWREGQCGHIIASAGCGEYLRFNRINLTLQHDHCNNPRFTPNASALNAIHYDQRYGEGKWEELYEMRKLKSKNPTQKQYRSLISNLDSFKEASRISVPFMDKDYEKEN